MYLTTLQCKIFLFARGKPHGLESFWFPGELIIKVFSVGKIILNSDILHAIICVYICSLSDDVLHFFFQILMVQKREK